MPGCSVIIPFANRSERALAAVCRSYQAAGVQDIVVVNSGAPLNLEVLPELREVRIPLLYWWPNLLRNIGIFAARNETVIVGAADVVLETAELSVVPDDELHIANTCYLLTDNASRRYEQAPFVPEALDWHEYHKTGFMHGAMIATRRTWLENFCGFYPELRDWGYNERELLARLPLARVKERIVPFTTYHLWHPTRQPNRHALNEALSADKRNVDWFRHKAGPLFRARVEVLSGNRVALRESNAMKELAFDGEEIDRRILTILGVISANATEVEYADGKGITQVNKSQFLAERRLL